MRTFVYLVDHVDEPAEGDSTALQDDDPIIRSGGQKAVRGLASLLMGT